MEDIVEDGTLVQREIIPTGAKSLSGFLLGVLKAEVSIANFQKLNGVFAGTSR